MAGFIFGGPKVQSRQQPALTSMQIQTSAYGKAVPIVYGVTRIAPEPALVRRLQSHFP